jgi:hypothetical protein
MSERPMPKSVGHGASGGQGDMTTEKALEVARHLALHRNHVDGLTRIEEAAVQLAAKVIAMREAQTGVASSWSQHRARLVALGLIPDDLRDALDTLTETRSS